LEGIDAAAASWQATHAGVTAAQESAAHALFYLCNMLHYCCAGSDGASMRPPVTAAIQLADHLINGSHGGSASASGGGCSCCLAVASTSAAPVLSFRRAASPMPKLGDPRDPIPTGSLTSGSLTPLRQLLIEVSVRSSPDDMRLIARRGGLNVELQHLALAVLQARQTLAGGAQQRSRSSRSSRSSSRPGSASGAGSSGGGSIPSCADLEFFLGDVDAQGAAALSPLMFRPEVELVGWSIFVGQTLGYFVTPLVAGGSTSECPRCFPQQLLLMLEAATMHPPATAFHTTESAPNGVCSLGDLVLRLQPAGRPWLTTFLQGAIPTLSAWVLAASEHLAAGRAVSFYQSYSVLTAATLLLLPQGGAQSQAVPREQLLPAAELALRRLTAADHERFRIWLQGLGVLQVIGFGGREGTAMPRRHCSNGHSSSRQT